MHTPAISYLSWANKSAVRPTAPPAASVFCSAIVSLSEASKLCITVCFLEILQDKSTMMNQELSVIIYLFAENS